MSTICNIAKKIEYVASPASNLAQISALSINLCCLAKVLFRSNTENLLIQSSGFNKNIFATFFKDIDNKVYNVLFLTQKIKQSIISRANQRTYRNGAGIILKNLKCSQSNIPNNIHPYLQSSTKLETALQKGLPTTATKHCQKILT